MPEPRQIVRTDIAKKLDLDPENTTFEVLRQHEEIDRIWGLNQEIWDEMHARLDGARPRH
jgi:hypothetical protein